MAVKQSYELIRYISGLPIANDGTIVRNEMDTDDTFESELYTPTYSVSVLARIVQNTLNNGTIEVVDVPVEKDTITWHVLRSDLDTYAPNIDLLMRSVLLESFALVYSITEARENLKYITYKDIFRIKENINYLADYMGTEDKYLHMIEYLRSMNVSLGYIQHQVDVIMNEGRVIT